MYWILTKRQLAVSEIEEVLLLIFPELQFHYTDDSKPDWFESPFFHFKDGKSFTFSVNDWTDILKTKIEFHDLNAETAIKLTQYIGYHLSKTYQTIVVTELDGDGPYVSYRSLMINQDRLVVIDDDGIENNRFEFREVQDYNGKIDTFDKYGCQ